jgi:FixJ family two-component response regulator
LRRPWPRFKRPSERCGCTRHDRVRTTSDGDKACDPNSSSAGLHGLRAAVTPIRLAHSATPAHPDARKTDQQENTVTGRPTPPRGLASGELPIVYVIDDDESMRRALTNLFQSVSLRVEVFGSAPELLQRSLPDVASCLVLDIRLPGLSGLDFQTELAKANIRIPIIFMTGHGDIPMTVRAMKAGAVDFLAKPFRHQEMLDAVAMAIERDRKRRKDEKMISNAQALFETLTPRERDVLALVAAGRMNKQIAAEIGIAEITVKIHRGHIMKKMGTRSLADLVRITEMLRLRRAQT